MSESTFTIDGRTPFTTRERCAPCWYNRLWYKLCPRAGRVGAKLVQRKACLAGSDSMGPSSAEMRLFDTSADGGGKTSRDVSFSFYLRGKGKEVSLFL